MFVIFDYNTINPNNPNIKRLIKMNEYMDGITFLFWFFVLFYIILLILIRFIEILFRKIDKIINKKQKRIKIYCEILKTNECKHPNLQCGNCQIWVKNIKKEFLQSKEYKESKINFKI